MDELEAGRQKGRGDLAGRGTLAGRGVVQRAASFPSEMQLVFIHGPAACGKFTVASEFATLSSMRPFHNHLTVDLIAAHLKGLA